VNYRFQSRFPYSPIVPDGSVNLNVCNFQCSFFEQNLSQNRSERVNLMNVRLDKSFKLGGSMKATLMLDIYNILNADPVTNFNLNDAPGYKNVIAVLDPPGLPDGVQVRVLDADGVAPRAVKHQIANWRWGLARARPLFRREAMLSVW
jgi:hypothetical protein